MLSTSFDYAPYGRYAQDDKHAPYGRYAQDDKYGCYAQPFDYAPCGRYAQDDKGATGATLSPSTTHRFAVLRSG